MLQGLCIVQTIYMLILTFDNSDNHLRLV